MKKTFEELEAREAFLLNKTIEWHGRPFPMLGVAFSPWGDASIRLKAGSVIELWVRTNWCAVPADAKPPTEERNLFDFRGAFRRETWRQVDYCLPL